MQGRRHDLVAPAAARQPQHGAACIRVPVGRAEPGKRGHDDNVFDNPAAPRNFLGCGRRVDDAQFVAQPLHGGAGHEDAAFQCVGHLARDAHADRGQQVVLGMQCGGAGIGDDETTGAISTLRHALLEPGRADQRRLLVARDTAHGDLAAEAGIHGHPEVRGAVAHLGQQLARNAERGEQLVIPVLGVDIEQQRPRSIGCIGRMNAAAGQAPQQKTVDRSEGQLAGFRPRPRALDMLQDPGHLGAGKIRVEPEPGAGADRRLEPLVLEPLAILRGAPVLPHDGVVHRRAGLPVPDNGRFALIGQTDCQDIAGRGARLVERRARHRDHRRPDRLGIVLHPTRPGIELGEFLLLAGHDIGIAIVDNRAAAARALVDGQQEFFAHDSFDLAEKTGWLMPIRWPASCGHG